MPGFELYGNEEKQAINEWFDINNGVMFAHGFDKIRKNVFKVRDFEKTVASSFNVKYAQAVSSGSSALLVALRALGVKAGDEVITSAFTFVATVEAIIESGATPIIAEVDTSLNIDPIDIEKRITSKTKVIIPVHMAGCSADMDAIKNIAYKYNLFILEDTAQAFGGSYKNKILGTIGDVGIYSFDFAKNITCGEGGMVVTNNQELYEKSRAYHDHGHEYNSKFPRGKDTRSMPGFNFRMTEIQAVLGLTQFNKLNYILEKQKFNKNKLKKSLSSCNVNFRKVIDKGGDIGDSVIFFLKNENIAKEFSNELYENNMGTKNLPDALTWHYAGTWSHLFKDFSHLKDCESLWPTTDKILKSAVALPIMINMDLEYTINSVLKIMKKFGL